MATKVKRTSKKSDEPRDRMVNNLKDYSNDPFFVKKTKEAEELIKKIGLPPPREFKK
jgi:hypothetical protein